MFICVFELAFGVYIFLFFRRKPRRLAASLPTCVGASLGVARWRKKGRVERQPALRRRSRPPVPAEMVLPPRLHLTRRLPPLSSSSLFSIQPFLLTDSDFFFFCRAGFEYNRFFLPSEADSCHVSCPECFEENS